MDCLLKLVVPKLSLINHTFTLNNNIFAVFN